MITQLLNIHKVKFVVLEELFKDYKMPKVINLHIDLHSILADLYKADNYAETNWINAEHGVAISSCIINIAAHYRLFFYSKYKVNTRIFFYFCNSKPRNNTTYYAEYGNRFFDKYSSMNEEYAPVNIEVNNNLKLCKIISSYLPNIFYIDCTNIEPMVAASYMITKHNGPSLVLTKDIYWYQCVNLPNTMVLHLKRDESYLVDKKNVFEVLLEKNSYKAKYITSDLLSVVYSFSGVKSRDIRGLINYGNVKIIKILDMAINRNIIKSSHTHIKNILDEIYTGDSAELLINIFKAIDLQYQLNELTSSQKKILADCLEHKYNKRDLLKLNVTHYTHDYSLMLDELFKGSNASDGDIKW